MISNYLKTQLLFILISVVLTGCGNEVSTIDSQIPVSALERALPCIECHDANVSPGTGKVIAEEYKMSAHALKNGAACPDCHAPTASHPLSCGKCHGGEVIDNTADLIRNPDEAGRCLKCHGKLAPVRGFIKNASMNIHGRFSSNEKLFNHYTTAANPVAFVTSQNIGKCRNCHNQHYNTLIPQFREWAQSGHGNPAAGAFKTLEMKPRGSNRAPKDLPFNVSSFTAAAYTPIYGTPNANGFNNRSQCVRCHTSSGFIRYVSSGFQNISAWGNNSTDWGRQTLYCNCCHYSDQNGRSYNYTVRIPPPAMGFYNYSSKPTKKILLSVQYPNLNQSNNCMNCHVGSGAGPQLKVMDQNAFLKYGNYSSFFKDRTPASGVTPATTSDNGTINGSLSTHYFTAGATMFKSIAYEYAGRNYADENDYKHNLIGMDNFRETTTKGPCVMCHVFPGRMTFMAVESAATSTILTAKPTGTITNISSPTCAKCHDGSFQAAWTPELLSAKKAAFQYSIQALIDQLTLKKNMNISGTTLKYKATVGNLKINNTYKNWRNIDTLGAVVNYMYLFYDFGAFAHNSRYAKRLLYDSIDYIDDGVLNYSVGNTLDTMSPAPVYKDTVKAYLLKDGTTTQDANERL